MASYTRHLFVMIRRFVRSHRAEAGRWAALAVPDGPAEYRLWRVVVFSPYGEGHEVERFLEVSELAGWAAAGRWLLACALQSVEGVAGTL